jgi:hypothetical protein
VPVVNINTEDIAVFGPPEFVIVSADFGEKGERGTQIYVGAGDPNIIDIGVEPVLNDLYINASPDADYSFLYQYVSEPAGNTWAKVLRINPALYSKIYSTTFASGSASIQIPISNISSVSGLVASNFNIKFDIENSNPVASSISSVSVANNTLTVVVRSSELSGGTWSNLSGTKNVHVLVSINQ